MQVTALPQALRERVTELVAALGVREPDEDTAALGEAGPAAADAQQHQAVGAAGGAAGAESMLIDSGPDAVERLRRGSRGRGSSSSTQSGSSSDSSDGSSGSSSVGGGRRLWSRAGMLRWLHRRGFPIGPRCIISCLRAGDVEAADVAAAVAPPPAFHAGVMEAALRAAAADASAWQLSLMQPAAAFGPHRRSFLRRHGRGGGPWQQAWHGGAGGGRGGSGRLRVVGQPAGRGAQGCGGSGSAVAVLKWLHAHGCPIPGGTSLMAAAVQAGELEAAAWLHDMVGGVVGTSPN